MTDSKHEGDELKRAIRAKMVRCALHHYVGQDTDFRVGLVLHRAGLLKKEIPLPPLPQEVIEAVRNPKHETRISGPPGPVVFVGSPGQSQSGDAIFALDLLCAPATDAREAALAHFEQTVGKDVSYFSPLSESLLREYADDIRNEDASRWVGAAMRLEKELDADFKFNLAAFRQGILTNVHELSKAHWSRLLRPSVASLLSVSDDGYELLKSREAFESAVGQMVEESETLSLLLTRYVRRFGHLLLHQNLSIGAVVQRWFRDHPNESLLPALRTWKRETADVVSPVHVCEIFLLNQDVLSELEQRQLWDELVAMLERQPEGGTLTATVAALALEADLARHYFQYLEARTVSMNVDRLATVAWWAAHTVANVVAEGAARAADPAAFLERIRDKSLRPELEASNFAWQMIHPSSGDSSVRFATMFVRQPRILHILIVTGNCIQQLPMKTLSAEHRSTITEAFGGYLMGCFPLEQKPSEQAVWAFDCSLLLSFKQWAANVLDPVALGKQQALIALCEVLADVDQRRDALKGLPDAGDPVQTFVAHVFRVLACASGVGAEQLWALAVDKDWREGCFRGFGQEALEALFFGIMELRRRREEVRDIDISHWFADAVQASGEDKERRSWFFGLMITASAVTGTVSAIRRIVAGATEPDLAEDIASWRRHADGMLPSAPPLLAMRLRDILSSLRAT